MEKKWLELKEKIETLGTAKVTFTKKDGSRREMLCTRDLGLIPPAKHPKGTGKVQGFSSVPVFDLDKQDWRSFQLDSVISIEAVEP